MAEFIRDNKIQGEFNPENVAYFNCENALVFAVAKTSKPYKDFALAEEYVNGKHTGWYTVPKSFVFAYRAEKLADGSRVNVVRTKTVPYEMRKALFAKGIADKLKVREIGDERAAKVAKPKFTLDGWTNLGDAIGDPLHVKL